MPRGIAIKRNYYSEFADQHQVDRLTELGYSSIESGGGPRSVPHSKRFVKSLDNQGKSIPVATRSLQLMVNPYYQRPSKLGQPLLDLMGIDTSEDCITTIEACEVLYGYDFCHCSIVKYLWRLGNKDSVRKDCDKILDYIDRAIHSGSHIAETLGVVGCRIKDLMDGY